jgi:hypothetical protein
MYIHRFTLTLLNKDKTMATNLNTSITDLNRQQMLALCRDPFQFLVDPSVVKFSNNRNFQSVCELATVLWIGLNLSENLASLQQQLDANQSKLSLKAKPVTDQLKKKYESSLPSRPNLPYYVFYEMVSNMEEAQRNRQETLELLKETGILMPRR